MKNYQEMKQEVASVYLRAGKMLERLDEIENQLNIGLCHDLQQASGILKSMKDEIQKVIEADSSIRFERDPDINGIIRIFQLGYMPTTYDKLVKAFGPPSEGDAFCHYQWRFVSNSGDQFVIYDWKGRHGLKKHELLKQEHNWQISGTETYGREVQRFLDWVVEKLEEAE